MIRSWVGVTVLGLVCWTGTAKADPDTHDGFQFRGTLGGGYLHDTRSYDPDPLSFGDVQIKGGAALLELYFGGTPIPGLVFGGYLSGMSAPGPTVEAGDQSVEAEGDQSIGLGSIGPYVDFYPNPRGGFHVLGTLGYGQVSFSEDGDTNDDETSSGFMLGAGVGYDAFVSDEWSLGGLAKLGYAWTGHEVGTVDAKDNAWMLGLSFSVSCH
jgi:opacity protein-like surface antigen